MLFSTVFALLIMKNPTGLPFGESSSSSGGIFSIVLIIALSAAGCPLQKQGNEKLLVIASIQPLASIVHEIGGEFVEVKTVVPPGANPHIFDLTPDLLLRCRQARLVVLVGYGLEFWSDKLLANIDTGRAHILTAEKILSSPDCMGLPGSPDSISPPPPRFNANPHIWLDPVLMARVARGIGAELADRDPAHASTYARNSQRVEDSLRALDREIRTNLSTIPPERRRFVAQHASWEYFARRYGLEQAAVLERVPGREVTPAELSRLVELVRNSSVPLIFGETSSPSKAASALAVETGARLVLLDPLGSPATAMSYFELMRFNAFRIVEAFR
ncbi:MAG: metal ABC transporter substrate-binding protein [Bacteroidota bacterium]|nr:metal ABC transporter substrate-binding protein [Bacteroidota bacterium]